MSDEFKKAIEEAMKELEDDANKDSETPKRRRKSMKRISSKTKQTLR